MLGHDPALNFEESVSKRSPKRVVAVLTVLAGCSLLWTGCSTFNQNAQAASPNAAVPSASQLPNATVGSSYRAQLSVDGGETASSFAITEGKLPSGLELDAVTGDVSGTPTHAGNFRFAISNSSRSSAKERPVSEAGKRTYALNVVPCAKCVTVRISPTDPSIASGEKVQFVAVMSNTSNTAVTWSASAGSITSTGLFTAPSVKSAAPITVTAKNVAAEASVTGTVTPASTRLAITTGGLPSGIAGTSYATTLTASGGTQPYRWSVISGSLPSGVQLDSLSGVISGLASQSGSYPFSVQIADSTGAKSSTSLTLTVNSQSGSNCGPPSYPCSRTDTELLVPTAPPHLGSNPSYYGGHLGAGMVASDPMYNNNRILRVTDGNTDALHPGESFATDSSAEKNETSYDESLFMVHSATGACLFQFDAASFSATLHGCFNNVGGDLDFGYTQADQRAFYSFYRQKLYRFVVNTSNWTIAADPTFNGGLGYFDPDNSSCLNGQIAANNWYIAGSALSSDDNTVIAAVGPEQDSNRYFVVWNAAKGCEWMNVQTWQVSQGWNTGLNNPVNIVWASGNTPTLPGGIHNAQLDRSGAYGVLTIHLVPSLAQKLFWTIGTNKVDDTCVKCMSHWACDFGVCFWSADLSLSQLALGSSTFVPDMSTSVPQPPDDLHMSHANAVPGAMLPYIASYQPGAGGSTVSSVWADEIVGVSWDGSQKTYRFNKSWTSGYGGFNTSSRCKTFRSSSCLEGLRSFARIL
jgi:hypothetical protein